MFNKKCLFKSWKWDCSGEVKKFDYIIPFDYWGWPDIYLCEFHKDFKFDWRDALNSRSNVKTNNAKMTHTKEFSPLQGMDEWLGTSTIEITFCSVCKGTGEIGDCQGNLELVKPCEECKCTGRWQS